MEESLEENQDKRLLKMQFDPEIAKKIGIDAAIIYENIRFWCYKNEVREINMKDDRYWTYNSASSFQTRFPWLSESTIKRILRKLVEEKYLISGRFNKFKYDRTMWYSDIVHFRTMEGSLSYYGRDGIVPPIPDSKPDSKPYPFPPEKSGEVSLNSIPSKVTEDVITVFESLMEIWNKANIAANATDSKFLNTTAVKRLLPSCRKFTPHIKKYLKKLLDDYTQEEIENTIKRYIQEILGRDPNIVPNRYLVHRFTFYEFIKQENGFVKFFNKL